MTQGRLDRTTIPNTPPTIRPNSDSLQDTNARLECIADELHSARISNDEVLESHVPKSVMRDGITIFRRRELIEELSSEQNNLRYMMKLHFIDMEFHEANRTSKQHIECVALHGYRTFLWTKDARVTLEREHSRLVARMVATEIAGDILEWMLEGWHFGERQSRHNAVGYVPSIKKIGTIKAGIDAKVTKCQQPRKCDDLCVTMFHPRVEYSYIGETTKT